MACVYVVWCRDGVMLGCGGCGVCMSVSVWCVYGGVRVRACTCVCMCGAEVPHDKVPVMVSSSFSGEAGLAGNGKWATIPTQERKPAGSQHPVGKLHPESKEGACC